MKSQAVIIKLIGGGQSWLYLVINNRIEDAAHQDDRIGMARLRIRQKKGR